MRFKGERPRGGKIRYGLLGLVFLAGILSALGSIPITSVPPAEIDDQNIVKLKEQTAQLEKEVEELQKALVTEDVPEFRESYARDINLKQARIEHNNNYLEEVKKTRAGASCFTADMRVLTEGGAKPIGEIQVGDRVLSVDDDGRRVAAEVLRTYADRNRHYYLINGGIKVTGLHRFFTDKGWKRAEELARGDRIQNASGAFEEIGSIDWVPADNLAVYNLTISEHHNFFVSTDGKSGYLVHNSGGGGGGGGK